MRDLDWLRRRLADRDVTVEDVTDDYTVLGVMGPQTRDLMGRLDPVTDWSDGGFPFATSREVVLAGPDGTDGADRAGSTVDPGPPEPGQERP